MKKFVLALTIAFFLFLAWPNPTPFAEPADPVNVETADIEKVEHDCPYKDAKEKEEEEAKLPPAQCPKTFMKDKCFSCHSAPDFRLDEVNPHAIYTYPLNKGFEFKFDEGKPVTGYYVITDVDAEDAQKVMDYCERHGVKHLILELYTPGGSLGDAYKIVGLMRHWQAKGGIVETRVYGFAASAGFLIFASGTKGHRFASEQAELMWHELITLELFALSSPSSKEDEARVLRHLQDTANSWLAEVSNLTKDEVDELVKYKELWLTGAEAIKYGFADSLLGK